MNNAQINCVNTIAVGQDNNLIVLLNCQLVSDISVVTYNAI